MPAPLFTPEEIARLLKTRKHVEHEARYRRLPNRDGKLLVYSAFADEFPGALFHIELDRQTAGCHFTLAVKMDDARPMQAIARHDIHAPAHSNPDGSIMAPMIPHRHIYTPEMVTKFGAWDRLAEKISLPKNVCDRLWSKFQIDLDIHFSDTDTQLFASDSAR